MQKESHLLSQKTLFYRNRASHKEEVKADPLSKKDKGSAFSD